MSDKPGSPGMPTEIDLRYGLEPVIEPGDGAGSDSLEQFVDVNGPYCGEAIPMRLDLSADTVAAKRMDR
jgi:hypothetical protein